MISVYASVFVRTIGDFEPWPALQRVFAARGFVPWGALPPRYPAQPGEVFELFYCPAGRAGWAVLTLEAFEEVFSLAHECALKASPASVAGVLAIRRDWRQECVAKLYQGKGVALKVGRDRDDELPYLVPPSELSHFEAAVALLGLQGAAAQPLTELGRRVVGGARIELQDLAAGFGLPGVPQSFAALAKCGAHDLPATTQHHLFLSRESALYRNA